MTNTNTTKLSKRQQRQLEALKAQALADANESWVPQTIWLTTDKDAPFMSRPNGAELKPELRAQPIITVLPERYFQTW